MKATLHKTQSGVVLIIALIVLVAMTLAAIALVRSVDTNNLIAGNLAFQQSAVHSADSGIERAVTWLKVANQVATGLDQSDGTNGYNAAGISSAPDLTSNPPQTWDAYWNAVLDARAYKSTQTDSAGNLWSYVIDRLCVNTGPKTGGASCIGSPQVATAPVNAETISSGYLAGTSAVFYRITVRVAGPRNTVSYVQSVVAM
jgi:Tfp pilus assembly protein PilX